MSYKKFDGLSFLALSDFIDLISLLQKKYKVQAVEIKHTDDDSRDMYVKLQEFAYIEIESKYCEYTKVTYELDETELNNSNDLLNTIRKYIK